jgi:hypothetical protein
VRVRMRLALRLRGTGASGKAFEEITTTENVSAEGFMCNCISSLVKDAIVEVILSARNPSAPLGGGMASSSLRRPSLGPCSRRVPFCSGETVFATPAELPAKPYLTFARAWLRGSGSPANSRAAAVRVAAVLPFFQA